MTTTQTARRPTEMLDELMALQDPDHPDFLAYDLTDRQREFLVDLNARRQEDSQELLFLTEKQRDYLRWMHREVTKQIQMAGQMA